MTPKPESASSSLPRVATSLAAEQVLDRLQTASKRGRMAGFEKGNGGLFTVAAHGVPFDGVLVADLRDGRLRFSVRMSKKLPAIFAAVLVFTIWPGVYFMDELIAVFTPSLWRPWITYYWYLPITIVPIPWVWRGLMRKSRTSMHASAMDMIKKIAAEIDGTIETQPTPR